MSIFKKIINKVCSFLSIDHQGLGLKNIPSYNAIRQVVSNYVNSEMQPTNWITNIMGKAVFGREALEGKQMDDYVQVLELFPEFSMTLATESQYKALHIIPV